MVSWSKRSRHSCLCCGTPRAQVTEEDFIEHHANLSFGVKSDADFRDLVIGCWGLDGGGGADGGKRMSEDVADVLRRAHAPRRKFLVSRADGSQCVEELPFVTAVRCQISFSLRLSGPTENLLRGVVLFNQARKRCSHRVPCRLNGCRSVAGHISMEGRSKESSGWF